MKKLSYLLISLTFTFACVSLWAMLTAVAKLSPHWSQTLPAFTRLCLDLSPWLLALPIPVVAFCVFALVRRNERQGQEWGLTFLAGSMTNAVPDLLSSPRGSSPPGLSVAGREVDSGKLRVERS